MSCELLNLLRCSNPSSGPKFARAKLARFLGRGLLAAGAAGSRRGAGGPVVLRPSLKRVVPGSVPPWRAPCFAWPAAVSGCRALIFVPPPWFSTSGQKHGSDALAQLKRPCCGAAPFFFRRQARSSKLEAGKPRSCF